MEVTVKFVSPLRLPSGRKEERIKCPPKTTIRDLFGMMEETLGQEFSRMILEEGSKKVKSNIAVCLQREGSRGYQRIEFFEGVDTELQAKDLLVVFYPMSGG